MCEFITLGLIDTIMSFVIFSMNIIYVIWGWFMPNDPNREEFSEYMEKLQSYLNFVTYSDSLVITIKIIIVILIQYVLCKKKIKGTKSNNQSDHNGAELPGTQCHRGNEQVTDQCDNNNETESLFPNFLKMTVSRKKNIVEV